MKKLLFIYLLLCSVVVSATTPLTYPIYPLGGANKTIYVKSGGSQEDNDLHFKWFIFPSGKQILGTDDNGFVMAFPYNYFAFLFHTHLVADVTNWQDCVFTKAGNADLTDHALSSDVAGHAILAVQVQDTELAEFASIAIESADELDSSVTINLTPVMGGKGWEYHDVLMPIEGRKGEICGMTDEDASVKGWVYSFVKPSNQTSTYLGTDTIGNVAYFDAEQLEDAMWKSHVWLIIVAIVGLVVGFLFVIIVPVLIGTTARKKDKE